MLDDRRIFLSTGYKRGCTLLEIQGDELEPLYEKQTMSNHMNNCVVDDGFMYGFDGNAHRGRTVRLVCIEIESGEQQWSQLGMGCGSLMIAGDKLVVLGEKGELIIGELNSKQWVERSRTQAIDYRCWTVPVLANGQVFCRNDAGDLSCIDLRRSTRTPN